MDTQTLKASSQLPSSVDQRVKSFDSQELSIGQLEKIRLQNIIQLKANQRNKGKSLL